jgi:hypothetical protein
LLARGWTLERAHAAEDVGHVVESLVYFADAETEPMPTGLDEGAWSAIACDIRRWVAALP